MRDYEHDDAIEAKVLTETYRVLKVAAAEALGMPGLEAAFSVSGHRLAQTERWVYTIRSELLSPFHVTGNFGAWELTRDHFATNAARVPEYGVSESLAQALNHARSAHCRHFAYFETLEAEQ